MSVALPIQRWGCCRIGRPVLRGGRTSRASTLAGPLGDGEEPDRRAGGAGELRGDAHDQELIQAFMCDLFQLSLFDQVDTGLDQQFRVDGEYLSGSLGGPYLDRCLVGADGDDTARCQPLSGVEADPGAAAEHVLVVVDSPVPGPARA